MAASDNAEYDVHQTDPSRLAAVADGVMRTGKAFRVIHDGQSRGIYDSAHKAEAVYKKYVDAAAAQPKGTGRGAASQEIERRLKMR